MDAVLHAYPLDSEGMESRKQLPKWMIHQIGPMVFASDQFRIKPEQFESKCNKQCGQRFEMSYDAVGTKNDPRLS
jgi:hypothetical protein